MPRNFVSWLIILMLTFAVGCGQSKPTPNSSSPAIESTSSTNSGATKPDSVSAVVKPLVATATSGTAEAAFQQTLIAFQDCQLDQAFDFLPPSYQSDVNDLIHEFAGKMDAELWSKTFGLVAKFGNLLQSKKASFLNLDALKEATQFGPVKPHWDEIASGINRMATSDVADVDRLKKTDVRELLTSASQSLKGIPLPSFGDVKVTTVASKGDTTTLSYRESKDSPVTEVEFVKVDGKWLPKSIATGWADWMSSARKTLADLPERVKSVKPQLMTSIETIDGLLDQLQQTKTQDEFNQSVVPLLFSIALQFQTAQQLLKDVTVGPRSGNAVHCILDRELTNTEQTQFKDAMISAVSNGNVDYEIIPNDGKTRCRFTPITDPEALRAAVTKHFQNASVRLDSPAKTIYVEFK